MTILYFDLEKPKALTLQFLLHTQDKISQVLEGSVSLFCIILSSSLACHCTTNDL